MTDAVTSPRRQASSPAAAPKAGRQSLATKRLDREWRTIAAMVDCYCQANHASREALCPECQGLLDYASLRLQRCRFGVEKPTCVKCPVHCYQPARREQVRTVMRYAGPRMLYRHPILSIYHWIDGFRQTPALD